ncbi:MAG: DUF1189 family protein [Nitrospirota bacterium]
MRNYTIIHPLFLSFFSRALYRDVARNWKGWGVAYLLLLLSLFWIPETLKIQKDLSAFLAGSAPHYVEQVPTITITNGQASTKETTPLFIYQRDGTTPFAIIDTTGTTSSLGNSPAVLLLTRTALIARNGLSETRTFDLAGIDELVVDKRTVYQWIEWLKAWLPLMLFPFALFFSFLFHLFQTFFAASIGALFARLFGVTLDFRTLVRLAAVSFTPAVLLQIAHVVLDISFPYKSLFSFLIALGYLYYAVGANSEAENAVEDLTA